VPGLLSGDVGEPSAHSRQETLAAALIPMKGRVSGLLQLSASLLHFLFLLLLVRLIHTPERYVHLEGLRAAELPEVILRSRLPLCVPSTP